MAIYKIDGETINQGYFPSISLFRSLGVIGDSYASGEIYTESLIDYYSLSWGQILGRYCGIKVNNYSKGGLSCQEWLEDTTYGLGKLNATNPDDIYIVAMGINDAYELGIEKLGTIADVVSDSTDSFYSYYGRVIRAITSHAPNAIIMLSTLARWSRAYDAFSEAVRNIGNYYGFSVLDLDNSTFFSSSFYRNNMASNHPIAVNYSAMAKEYADLIERALEENVQHYTGYVRTLPIDYNSQNYITPESCGAVGDGTTNDFDAIQSAIDNAGLILFSSGKNYKITSTLRLKADTILDLNGATITSTAKRMLFNFLTTDTFTGYNGNGNITIRNGTLVGGSIAFGHGENIRFENITFLNCLNDHIMEVCACKNYVVEGCRFIGMADSQTSVYEYINLDMAIHGAFPHLPDGSAFYDGMKNDGVKVNNCYFSIGEGAFAYGYNAMGVHGGGGVSDPHKNITFTNNTVKGFVGCGFRANDMQGVYIAGNNIQIDGDGILVGDKVDVDDIVIIDNYIVPGVSSEMIKLTAGRYTNLTKSGNVAKGTNN